MKIELMHHTPLSVCANAILICHDRQCNSDGGGAKDKSLIHRVGNKLKHSSTLEHIVYSFSIEGISRALLQELARHRIASYTVKSSRYTLDELRTESRFVKNIVYNNKLDRYRYVLTHTARKRALKYIVMTGDRDIDEDNIVKLDMLRVKVAERKPNDLSKYSLPECYKTSLSWTINARALQNFITLRTGKDALWEIRLMAKEVFNQLPEEHKYLFEDCIYENKNT